MPTMSSGDRKLPIQENATRSWEEYVSSINSYASTEEIFTKIRRINGHGNTSIKMLKVNDIVITDQTEIAECFATHYEETTSTGRYSAEFQQFKAIIEENLPQIPEDFSNEN